MASGRQLCWVLGCVAVVLSAFVAEPHVANGRNTYRSALEKKARVLDWEKWSLRQSLPVASFDRRPAGPPQVREEAGQDKSHVNPALLYGCSWLSSGFWEIKLAKIGLRQPNKRNLMSCVYIATESRLHPNISGGVALDGMALFRANEESWTLCSRHWCLVLKNQIICHVGHPTMLLLLTFTTVVLRVYACM